MATIEIKKMTRLLLHALFLVGLTRASFDFDYEDTVSDHTAICNTNDYDLNGLPDIKCACSNRENFTMSPVFDYEVTRITIEGCGNVRVPFAALINLRLEKLEFVDIQSLVILPFALSPAHGVEILEIRHISNLVIHHHAFVGLHNVDTLIISNVTSEIISKDAFSSISGVRFLLIENSTFNHVEQLAFAVHNVTYFKVLNSQFHALENCSFLIHDSKEVRFEDCLFENTDNGTFILSYVDCLYFQNCRFGDFASTSIQSNALQLFNLSDSIIDTLQPNAFDGLEVQDKIVFKRNTIKIAFDTSLTSFILPKFDYLDVDFCCNSFTCDCSVHWLWNLKELRANISILERNTCIENSSSSLSLYVPIIDSYNNCMTLELKSSQTGSKISHYDLSSNGSHFVCDFIHFIIICMLFLSPRILMFKAILTSE